MAYRDWPRARLMRLLFDHNLSCKLVRLLADGFPKSQHVREVGLTSASDNQKGYHSFSPQA